MILNFVSRNGALKVLNHALSGPEGKDNCSKFIEVLGLRTIFPLFMKTPKKQKRKGVSIEQHEEHVVSIVASLFKNCKGSHRSRIMIKFTESDHEKVERLMELHFKYVDRVSLSLNYYTHRHTTLHYCLCEATKWQKNFTIKFFFSLALFLRFQIQIIAGKNICFMSVNFRIQVRDVQYVEAKLTPGPEMC